MSDWASAGLALVVSGVVLIGLGIPLVRGRVRRNIVYGYRTRRTMSDDRIWYPVNMMLGLWLVWAGALAAVIGVLLLLLRNSDDAARLVLGIGIIALLLCLAMGIYRGWRMSRLIDEQIHQADEG
jgi:uncharacterized membrane protein